MSSQVLIDVGEMKTFFIGDTKSLEEASRRAPGIVSRATAQINQVLSSPSSGFNNLATSAERSASVVSVQMNKMGSSFHGGAEAASRELNGISNSAQTMAVNVGKHVSNISSYFSVERFRNFGQELTSIGQRITTFARSAVDAASDLGESQNKANVVFGQSVDAINKFAQTSASALGLSKQKTLEATATLGNLFTAMQIGRKPAADMSIAVVKLASDLASFNNVKPEVALEKLRAGLTGEAEPLKALGVMLNETTMKAKATEMGFKAVGGQFTEQQKVMARYQLILEQTKTAQGDFANTSLGLANATRIAKAHFEDLSAELGARLLPIMNQGMAFINRLLQSFMSLPEPIKNTVLQIAAVALAAGPAAVVVGKLVTAFSSIYGVVAPLLTSMGGLSGAFALLTGPVGIAAAAVAGFVALVAADVGGLRTTLSGILSEIGELFKRTWAALQDQSTTLGKIWDGIKAIFAAGVQVVGSILNGFFSVYKAIFQALNGHTKEAGDTLRAAAAQIWEKIVDYAEVVMSKLPQILDGIWTLIKVGARFAWDGLVAYYTQVVPQVVTAIVGFLKELPGKVWPILVDLNQRFVKWGADLLGIAGTETKKVPQLILEILQALPGKIYRDVLIPLNDFFIEKLGQLAGIAKDLALKVALAVIDEIKQIPSRVAEELDGLPGIVAEKLGFAVGTAARHARDIATSIIDEIKGIPGHVESALLTVQSVFSKALGFIQGDAETGAKGIYERIKEWISKIPELFAGMAMGAIQAIKELPGRLYEKAKEMAGRFMGGFKDGFTGNSGLNLDQIGADAVGAVASGIEQATPKATQAAKELVDETHKQIAAGVKKIKQTISESSPFITERAIAGSPEAIKNTVDRFVDDLVNNLNNNKDRVGEVGGSLASMFINRFEASLGSDKKSAFFENIIDDLRAATPALDAEMQRVMGTLRNLVQEVGVNLGEAGLQSEQTLRSIIDNLRKQVGITDAIWKGLDKTQKEVLDEGFRAVAQVYINHLRNLSIKTQSSAEDQSIAIKKLFADWRSGVIATEEFMARLSNRTEDMTIKAVSHFEQVGVAVKSLADRVDVSLKKIQSSIDNSEIFQTDRLASETQAAIEQIISFYEQYAEQLGLTGDAYDNFVNQKVRAATAEMKTLNKEMVDRVIKEHERLKVRLPGIWDEVFRDASTKTRKNVDDILAIIDLIPGRTGEALRKTESEFRRWYEMIDRTIRLIERSLGESETEGLMGVISKVASGIAGVFKKTNDSLSAETKSSSEKWADQISKALGSLGGGEDSGEAGEESGKSFSDGFMAKVQGIAQGLATFFGTRGQGRAVGVAGGALAGFQAGAAFGPWGMAIGAGVGAIAGLFGTGGPSEAEKRAAEEEQKRQIELAKQSLAKGYEELKQSMLTTARDFIKFVDEMAGSAQIPKDVLNKFINNMTRTLLKLAEAMRLIAPKVNEETKRASEQIAPSVDLMAKMPLAFEAINKHFGVADDQIDLYFSDLDKIAEHIGASAEKTPAKLEKNIKKYSERLLPSVDLMKGVGELIKMMFDTKDAPDAKSFDIWEFVIDTIVQRVGRLADKTDKWLVKTMAAYATKAKEALSFWKDGTDAIRATKDVPALTQADVDNTVGSLELFLTALVARLSHLQAEELNKLASMGASISSVASALKNWAETSAVIRGYTAISAEIWELIPEDFRRGLAMMHLMLADALIFVDEAKLFDARMTEGGGFLESGLNKFVRSLQNMSSVLNGAMNGLNANTIFNNPLGDGLSLSLAGGGAFGDGMNLNLSHSFASPGGESFAPPLSPGAPSNFIPGASSGGEMHVHYHVQVDVHGSLIHEHDVEEELEKAFVKLHGRGGIRLYPE
jgi:hypothetical protein